MTPLLVAAAATVFRIVPLACTNGRLAIGGGAVLRLADDASCARIVPGRPIAIALDAEGRARPQPLDATARPAAQIPHAAFVLAPAAENDVNDASLVTVTIDVTVPARTPPGDDIYLSTERSGWSPSEIRMDRVDARHYRLALRLHPDARVAFRITRGSYGTMERDASRALPPAHIAGGKSAGGTIAITVPAWADVQ